MLQVRFCSGCSRYTFACPSAALGHERKSAWHNEDERMDSDGLLAELMRHIDAAP